MNLNRKAILSTFMAALLFGGCTTNITINEENKDQSRTQEETNTESRRTETDSSDQSSKSESESKSESKGESKSESESTNESTDSSKFDSTPTAAALDGFGQEIFAAFESAGYQPEDLSVKQLPNGNIETMFKAHSAGYPLTIYATDTVTAELAEKTFAANLAQIQEYNPTYSVMEQGVDGNKTVEVVRDNMHNTNFVIAMNKDAPCTLYIIDQTPEQLEPVLVLLNKAGFPLAQ